MSQIHIIWMSIDKSIDFLFISAIVKEFIVTKSSVMEIKNLVMHPKSWLVKPNSK